MARPRAGAQVKPTFLGEDLCRGGQSFGCAQVIEFSRDAEGNITRDKDDEKTLHPHRKASPFNCRRCGAYMGCKMCAHPPADAICAKCRKWATVDGLLRHGKMARDRTKVEEAWKIVAMRQRGQISDQDADRLFAHLWSVNVGPVTGQ